MSRVLGCEAMAIEVILVSPSTLRPTASDLVKLADDMHLVTMGASTACCSDAHRRGGLGDSAIPLTQARSWLRPLTTRSIPSRDRSAYEIAIA